MTIRLAVHRICDRCMRPFDEASMKLAELGGCLPKINRKVFKACSVVEGPEGEQGGGKVELELFHFEDVCQKCEGVILGYIERIKLESQDEEDRPRKRAKVEKTETLKTAEAVKSVEVSSVTELPQEPKADVSANGAGIEVAVIQDVSSQSHLF